MIHRRNKIFLLFISFVLGTLLATGCSSSEEKSTSDSYKGKSESLENNSGGMAIQEDASKSNNLDQKEVERDSTPRSNLRKLIKNVTIDAETTDFNKSINQVEKSVKAYNGFIEGNQVMGSSVHSPKMNVDRRAEYVIRIPANKLDSYLSEIGKIGNILTKNIRTEDVTDQYFDIETRLSTLKVQEQRLLELLKKASSLKDIIELEKELTRIRYEIESFTTTIRKYDALIDYSTITLTLSEVKVMTDTTPPETIGERIVSTFKDNLSTLSSLTKNLTVFFIGNSPLLLLWGGMIGAVVLVGRKIMRKYY